MIGIINSFATTSLIGASLSAGAAHLQGIIQDSVLFRSGVPCTLLAKMHLEVLEESATSLDPVVGALIGEYRQNLERAAPGVSCPIDPLLRAEMMKHSFLERAVQEDKSSELAIFVGALRSLDNLPKDGCLARARNALGLLPMPAIPAPRLDLCHIAQGIERAQALSGKNKPKK